jgi:hypothetical protein
MDISPTSIVFSSVPSSSAAPESHVEIAAKDAENERLRANKPGRECEYE